MTQRGGLPFGAIRPFGPGSNRVDPQIGQRGSANSELASRAIASSSHFGPGNGEGGSSLLEMLEQALSSFVTLFVTIDPPGLAPIFLALTAGMSRAERLQVANRATITALCVLVLFAVAGLGILSVFGITIHAFRIAGGVLLFFIAFEMIFEKRQDRKEKSAEVAQADHVRNLAVFPLAIPLIAGPGAISATILLSGIHADVLERAVLIVIVAVNLAIAWLVFVAAGRIERLLGATGRIVLGRLLGLILAALAVQFVADGILAFARS
jgi:multiple antibiotic resistance protein